MVYPIRFKFISNESKIVRSYLPNAGLWGIKIFIVTSIQKIGNFQGAPYPIQWITNNLTERATWINEINNVINSGGSIKQHVGMISYTGSMVTEAFMKGEIVDSRVEFEQRDEFLDEKGKLYGASMIIANDKQVSNLLLFEMQRSDIIGTGFQRGQAYQAPAEPSVAAGVKPFEKPERVSVFQPKKILSPKIKKIIDDWSVKKIIVPAWFANNNMNWVLEGRITEQEFLDAYTNLINTGAITFTTPQVTIAPIPEITIPSIPEVSAEMQLITTNFQVKLDNKIQFSSSLSNADYKRLQDEMSLEPKITLVFLNQTDFNPLSNFSNVLRKIQKLLEGQVVETITISPTGQVITAPEPTVTPGKTGLMGAGVLGLIGILMLGGFIADHVRKRK